MQGLRYKESLLELLPTSIPKRRLVSSSPTPSTSRPVTLRDTCTTDGLLGVIVPSARHTTLYGKMCFSDYSVHDLPSDESCMDDPVSAP